MADLHKHPRMSLPRRLLSSAVTATVLAALVAGCETVPEPRPADDDAVIAARALLDEGRFGAAGAAFARLADDATGEQAVSLRIAAASAFARAGEMPSARDALATLAEARLEGELAARRDLVRARIALADGAPVQALAIAPRITPELADEVAAEAHVVRALALSASGRALEAVRERVAADFLLGDRARARANRAALWQTLSRLAPAALQRARVPPPDTFGGWIALADIAQRTATDPESLSVAVERWRSRWPGHPAGAEIAPELLLTSRIEATPPGHVALLLPLSGRFAAAATAIRDGFLAAWLEDSSNAERPLVTVRDTAGADVEALYREVVQQGADFVVGPLDKDAVRAIASMQALPVPSLALNQVDTPPSAPGAGAAGVAAGGSGGDGPGASVAGAGSATGGDGTGPTTASAPLYQFALSPEAEARRVAERAWLDGHERAAVLAPAGEWGERVGEAFVSEWQRLGGVVVERQTYQSDAADMSEPVSRLLNIDDSERRARELRQILNRSLEHEPRRRGDVDLVFMAAFPRQARQLRPQLEFHQAADVPVYATSHVYAGVEDAGADRDVEGVRFGDMPWVLRPDAGPETLRARIERTWPEQFPALVRLYAFGVDAYRIVPRLGRLRAQRFAWYEGQTGRLSVDERDRIDRRLVWAQFEAGVPRPAERVVSGGVPP